MVVPSYAPGVGIVSGKCCGDHGRTGDPAGVAFPNWSHNGQTIVYASTVGGLSGRLAMGRTDLYTVPFNDGLGGTAMPVTGAAEANTEEYYPAYSPDDRLIAFTRVPSGQVMYGNPNAELAVIPAGGGMPSRLRANSPPACTGKTSPGINTTGPSGRRRGLPAPRGPTTGSSSRRTRGYSAGALRQRRHALDPITPLYLAPVIQDEFGITSYPAILLWNQPTDSVNTTPPGKPSNSAMNR